MVGDSLKKSDKNDVSGFMKNVITSRLDGKNTYEADIDANTHSVAEECKTDLLELLSTHFLICNEKIQGKGEDSGFEAYARDAAVMGVFDGCGGLGSKICPNISDKTEAYLASRAVGNAVKQWFEFNSQTGYSWNADILKEIICANLDICKSCIEEESLKLKGSLIRSFPSTIAAITFQIKNGRLSTNHFWAGDSRTYILDHLGIAQISVDDINGEDAMTNLTQDGVLTNVVSADKNFILHKANYEAICPCIMLCSTDGCFAYLSSPMEFELLILSTLMKSACVEKWQKVLSDEISSRSGDDQTLALAAFGFTTFKEMKRYFRKRYKKILSIVQKFENLNSDERQLMWEQYKSGYYRNKTEEE